MPLRSTLLLTTTTILSFIPATLQAITTGPGPVIISPPITIESTLSPTSVTGSYASTSSCAAPNQQYLSYCCSGTLVQADPSATVDPSSLLRTTQAAAEITARALEAGGLQKRQSSGEAVGIGRTHSLQIFPETVLGSGVTCFGSVATVGGNVGSVSTSGSSSSSSSDGGISMTSSSAMSMTTGTRAGSGSSSTTAATTVSSTGAVSGIGATGTGGSPTSAIVGSSSIPVVSASSTASTGGARRGKSGNSLFSGLLGLLIAIL